MFVIADYSFVWNRSYWMSHILHFPANPVVTDVLDFPQSLHCG